jgi:transglutaminase-like putative cysteine protease
VDDHRFDFQRQRVIELILASNESLVAYRRRHRSDVEFATALQLVIADVHNPRAAASAIREVRHQADRLEWARGVEESSRLLDGLETASFESVESTTACSPKCSTAVIAWRVTWSVRISQRRSILASWGGADMPGQRYRVVHRTEYLYGATMLDGYSVACVLARPTPSQTVASSVVTRRRTPTSTTSASTCSGIESCSSVCTNRMTASSSKRSPRRGSGPRSCRAPTWRGSGRLRRSQGCVGRRRSTSPFSAHSRFVTIDANRLDLFDLASASFTPGRGLVEATTALCSSIFEEYVFDPSFTVVSSPLDVVLRERRGVCQDFAHLAVGALRTIGLAARYVSGYIETDPPPGEAKTIGADASHAWCSVWIPDHGWLDFDPTNGDRGAEPPCHHRVGSRLRGCRSRQGSGGRPVVGAVVVCVGRRRSNLTRAVR